MKVRLYAAAACCVLALGVAHAYVSPGYSVMGHYTQTINPITGNYETTYMPGYFVANSDFEREMGTQSIVRLCVLAAAGALGWAAGHRTRATRRAARYAVYALGFALLVALSKEMSSASLLIAVALALSWPVLSARPGGAVPPPTPLPR